jgi:hypothetical protein
MRCLLSREGRYLIGCGSLRDKIWCWSSRWTVGLSLFGSCADGETECNSNLRVSSKVF